MAKKKIFIVAFALIVTLFALMISINNKKKILLECTMKDTSDKQSISRTLKIYESKKSKYYDDTFLIKYDDKYKSAYDKVIDAYKSKLSEYQNVNGLDINFKTNDNSIKIQVIVNLSLISYSSYNEVLKYDYVNSSIDEAKDFLESEGEMQCKKH